MFHPSPRRRRYIVIINRHTRQGRRTIVTRRHVRRCVFSENTAERYRPYTRACHARADNKIRLRTRTTSTTTPPFGLSAVSVVGYLSRTFGDRGWNHVLRLVLRQKSPCRFFEYRLVLTLFRTLIRVETAERCLLIIKNNEDEWAMV